MWIVACLLALAAATPNAAPASSPEDAGLSSQEALRRYAWARLLEEQGDTAEALGEYYRILVLDPRSPGVLVRAAELSARAGDAQRSLELAGRALAIEPQDPRALWLRGSARFNLGQPNEGLSDLEQALTLDSTRVEYARSLARAAEDQNRIDLVARAYRRVTDLDWDDREAWFQLAAAEARIGNFSQARAALMEASESGHERPGALFLEGWIAEGLGDRDAAIDAYQRHLEVNPSDPTTRTRLVRLLAAAGRFDQALAQARRTSADDPKNLDAQEDVAELALRAGHKDEATHALDKMERLAPNDSRVLARRIDVLARNGRNDDAQGAAREWAKKHADDPEGAFQLARAYAIDGPVERAVEAAQRAIAVAPDSIGPRVLLARIHQNHQQWDQALAAWSDAMAHHPGHAGIALDYAFCLQAKGDTSGAEAAARKVLGQYPDHPQALNFLGYLLAEANRNLKEAEAMIRRALDRDPDNGAFVDSMGWVLYRLGRLTEARKELERAAVLTSGDAVVLEHLGDVYRDLHLVDLARQQYQKALAAQGDGTRLKSKLDGLR